VGDDLGRERDRRARVERDDVVADRHQVTVVERHAFGRAISGLMTADRTLPARMPAMATSG
jgi:hypothetical protein